MKHGPIALIDSDNPNSSKGKISLKIKYQILFNNNYYLLKIVILIILDDQHRTEMELALSEVKSRNAFTIVISDCF